MPSGVPAVAATATSTSAMTTTLTSWGGLVAPVAPLYPLPEPVASIVRELPEFQAARGGIEFEPTAVPS